MDRRIWMLLGAAVIAMVVLLILSPTAFPAELRQPLGWGR